MNYVETSIQQYLRAQLHLDKKFGPYADIAARDAIPVEDRPPMMVVGVLDSDGSGTNNIYALIGGTNNNFWEILGSGSGGDTGDGLPAKHYIWAWSDGVDVGGTHLDFVIDGISSDGEIGDIRSIIFFIGGSLQVSNFTIQGTNFTRDTIRVPYTVGEREPDVEVVLFYNRSSAVDETENIDGGNASSIYLNDQLIDGGNA